MGHSNAPPSVLRLREGVLCETCGWSRRIEVIDEGAGLRYPFREAVACHSFDNTGHVLRYPEAAAAEVQVLSDIERARGAAWIAGYLNGRTHAWAKIVEVFEGAAKVHSGTGVG